MIECLDTAAHIVADYQLIQNMKVFDYFVFGFFILFFLMLWFVDAYVGGKPPFQYKNTTYTDPLYKTAQTINYYKCRDSNKPYSY